MTNSAQRWGMPDNGGIEWLLFSPDSQRVYAGAGDGSLHLWFLEPVAGRSNHQILFGHDKKISAMAMPTDGRILITASDDGTARIWPMNPSEQLKLACAATGRGPTRDEWHEWLGDLPYVAFCD